MSSVEIVCGICLHRGYRGHKSGSLLTSSKYIGFFNKEFLNFNGEKEKNANPLYLLFSTSPMLYRSYFRPEPARSEMLSPYSCTYPLRGFMLNASL